MGTRSLFRFYITDLCDGALKGTDDRDLAEDLSQNEDYFVVDSETGEWLNADDGRVQVEEMK